MRKFRKLRQISGSSRSHFFATVWRRLGYQWVDVQVAEKWIQFLEGHRKTAPHFEFNTMHYKLLREVLEAYQNNRSASFECPETCIKSITVSI
jgi:hypothetical protein